MFDRHRQSYKVHFLLQDAEGEKCPLFPPCPPCLLSCLRNRLKTNPTSNSTSGYNSGIWNFSSDIDSPQKIPMTSFLTPLSSLPSLPFFYWYFPSIVNVQYVTTVLISSGICWGCADFADLLLSAGDPQYYQIPSFKYSSTLSTLSTNIIINSPS